jgi:hypothetical protein
LTSALSLATGRVRRARAALDGTRPRYREQPWEQGVHVGVECLDVASRTQQRFLHEVLCELPLAEGQPGAAQPAPEPPSCQRITLVDRLVAPRQDQAQLARS